MDTSYSIVPKGFENTAHPIFFDYKPPLIKKKSSIADDEAHHTTSNFKEMMSSLDTKCAICLCTFSDPVTICGCTHSFCRHCLERWLAVTEHCPMCKLEILVFISAEPGSSQQQLFSRKSITDTAVKADSSIPGMHEAVQMQEEIHSRLNSEVNDEDADDTGPSNTDNHSEKVDCTVAPLQTSLNRPTTESESLKATHVSNDECDTLMKRRSSVHVLVESVEESFQLKRLRETNTITNETKESQSPSTSPVIEGNGQI